MNQFLCCYLIYESDMTSCVLNSSRFGEITVVRNGGTHGDVSVDWLLTRNSTDPSPVTADISPSSGTLRFAQGQMLASILLTVVDDDLPEEAEVFLLTILPPTAQGGAEVSEPAQVGPAVLYSCIPVTCVTDERYSL